MKKSLMILLLSLTLVACGDDGETKDGKKGGGKAQNTPGFLSGNSNKMDACFSQTPAGVDITSKTWSLVQQDGQVEIRQTLQFSSNQITHSVECSYFGNSVKAQVQSPVTYSDNHVGIQVSGWDRAELKADDQIYVCNANLSRQDSFQYYFSGECLEVATSKGTLYFQAN